MSMTAFVSILSLQGIMVLVTKEWIHFGHQFQKRVGHASPNHSDDQLSPCFIQVPHGTYVFTLLLSVLCMCSKAWLAAPVLLAHAEVTANIIIFQWVQNLGTHDTAQCCG